MDCDLVVVSSVFGSNTSGLRRVWKIVFLTTSREWICSDRTTNKEEHRDRVSKRAVDLQVLGSVKTRLR